MWFTYSKLASSLKSLMKRVDGQDLVEYALLVGVIAAGLTASMKVFAGALVTAYTHIGTQLDAIFGIG
ncbi:MAG: Flp family type IVb pilin [Terracidiphilus sp.]|jgi:Flp pilus assembly pilin Flp